MVEKSSESTDNSAESTRSSSIAPTISSLNVGSIIEEDLLYYQEKHTSNAEKDNIGSLVEEDVYHQGEHTANDDEDVRSIDPDNSYMSKEYQACYDEISSNYHASRNFLNIEDENNDFDENSNTPSIFESSYLYDSCQTSEHCNEPVHLADIAYGGEDISLDEVHGCKSEASRNMIDNLSVYHSSTNHLDDEVNNARQNFCEVLKTPSILEEQNYQYELDSCRTLSEFQESGDSSSQFPDQSENNFGNSQCMVQSNAGNALYQIKNDDLYQIENDDLYQIEKDDLEYEVINSCSEYEVQNIRSECDIKFSSSDYEIKNEQFEYQIDDEQTYLANQSECRFGDDQSNLEDCQYTYEDANVEEFELQVKSENHYDNGKFDDLLPIGSSINQFETGQSEHQIDTREFQSHEYAVECANRFNDIRSTLSSDQGTTSEQDEKSSNVMGDNIQYTKEQEVSTVNNGEYILESENCLPMRHEGIQSYPISEGSANNDYSHDDLLVLDEEISVGTGDVYEKPDENFINIRENMLKDGDLQKPPNGIYIHDEIVDETRQSHRDPSIEPG